MVTMSRDMHMGPDPGTGGYEGNVAAYRAARVIVTDIWLGRVSRHDLPHQIRMAIDWVAQIGFEHVYDTAPSTAICSVVNEAIIELQGISKEARARRYPQAPVDIDSWPPVRRPRPVRKKKSQA
jgi:hypothetical protein